MYWKYGNYRLPDNAVSFVFTHGAKLDSSGVPYAYLPRYVLDGEITIADTGVVATNQANMTAALVELEAAFSVNFRDLVFYDDADQPTVHKLLNNETAGGVKVLTRVEYPDSRGGEYSTYRKFRVTLGAEVPDPAAQAGGGNNPVLRWQESLTLIGTGGRRTEWQEFVEGPPIQQPVGQQTTIRAIQEGTSLGLNAHIPFPAGIYPIEVERQPERIYRRGTAQQWVNGVATEYPANWTFFFQFADPAAGNPTGRPT